ncbi:hypothetical protein [Arsenicicoccus piscis]|uniref:Uncharacterized protein n=1 Tax=Arsenicicoccus piscis TaxID=673954 RepID=A0ABQ6HT25_9MICO|nr:hypothetical protein [Arsenicicoccus piscis]GMA21656.1 hypothetical protein GCM10025862_36770 [Arsenicicoccus piscis]
MMGNGYGMGWAMWLLMGGAALAFWIVVVLQWSPAEWCTTDLSERVPPT